LATKKLAFVSISKEWEKVFKRVSEKMQKIMLTLFFIEKWILDHYGLRAIFPHFLHKSISPFEKWTKKMSKNENPKYFWVKSDAFLPLLRIF
jgi:hypothetical protein